MGMRGVGIRSARRVCVGGALVVTLALIACGGRIEDDSQLGGDDDASTQVSGDASGDATLLRDSGASSDAAMDAQGDADAQFDLVSSRRCRPLA